MTSGTHSGRGSEKMAEVEVEVQVRRSAVAVSCEEREAEVAVRVCAMGGATTRAARLTKGSGGCGVVVVAAGLLVSGSDRLGMLGRYS